MSTYILALDQGTTSSRAIIFDKSGSIVAVAQKEFKQIFPKPGWVEHDPNEIWSTQLGVAAEVISKAGLNIENIAAIGITNQRETTVVWERSTGKPVYNAIVWQDRRTASFCDELKAKGTDKLIQQKTGLIIDAYFSGTKVNGFWIMWKGQERRLIKENFVLVLLIPGCYGTLPKEKFMQQMYPCFTYFVI